MTLSSFLKHHPREGREVYILQRGLGPVERASFAKLPFRYHFLEHDPRITDLAAGLPIPTERRDRLLVLQAFQLNDPEPILVLDADLARSRSPLWLRALVPLGVWRRFVSCLHLLAVFLLS